MLNYLRAELLKQKRTFNQQVIWIAPLLVLLMGVGLMGGDYAIAGAYNWWYTLFLPFTFMYVSVTIMTKDQKHHGHGLFGIVENKKKIFWAKIIVGTMYLLAANIIFFMMSVLGGKILNLYQIGVCKAFNGSILLFITFAWQVPFFMLIGQRIGVFLSALISLFCNMGIACICAVESYWWIPFAVPSRLMCPTIGVLPNGLLVEEAGGRFADGSVVLPGALITFILYGVMAWVTVSILSKKEA